MGEFRLMDGKKCEECGKGRYKDTSFFGHLNGSLECGRCGHVVPKHRSLKEEKLEKAALKALLQFKKELKLTYDDLSRILGKKSTLIKKYKKKGRLPIGRFFDVEDIPEGRYLREDVSVTLAIFINLAAMFQSKANRIAWLKTKHHEFKKSPLKVMKAGPAV